MQTQSAQGPQFANDMSGAELLDFDLDELLLLRVQPVASLTRTDKRAVPASITHISHEEIRNSGARDLDELLEIYVPGLQMMLKDNGNQLGFRGVISDRNNKFLISVNGRIMNTRVTYGAISERFTHLLGDIDHIEVVRGPGSATYGPGAIAGVIRIVTVDGQNDDGASASVRQDLGESFSAAEARYGKRFGDETDLSIYYGIDKSFGADQDESPVFFSSGFTTGTEDEGASGMTVDALDEAPFNIDDYGEGFRNQARHKFHAEFHHQAFVSWIRFVRGGISSMRTRRDYRRNEPDDFLGSGLGYQQLTALVGYRPQLSESLDLDLSLSYDINDSVRDKGSVNDGGREDELHARAVINYVVTDNHRVAVGGEISRETFAKQSFFHDSAPQWGRDQFEEWTTEQFSALAEYQWRILPQLHLLAGGRLDKHSYTDSMLSPRLSLIGMPTGEDTIKLFASRSVRRADDRDLRYEFLADNGNGISESSDNAELRYDRTITDTVVAGAAAFYSIYDLVTINNTEMQSTKMGNLHIAGVEIDGVVRRDNVRLRASHAFIKQLDFDLFDEDTPIQAISAAPYGYGNDLVSWHTHVSKVAVEGNLSEHLSASGSLRVFWGNPGGEDMTDYNRDVLDNDDRLPVTDDSLTAFASSAFINLGLQYAPSSNWSLRLDGHHLGGLLSDNLNKRNRYLRATQWRQTPVSVGLTLRGRY